MSGPIRQFPWQLKITHFGEEGPALAQEPPCFCVRWQWAGVVFFFSQATGDMNAWADSEDN